MDRPHLTLHDGTSVCARREKEAIEEDAEQHGGKWKTMEKENSTLGWRSVGTSNDRSGQNKMETYNTSAVRDNAEVLGLCCATKLLNNNNNNTPCCHHDHKVIARVHSVRVMNVEQRLKRPPTLRRSH